MKIWIIGTGRKKKKVRGSLSSCLKSVAFGFQRDEVFLTFMPLGGLHCIKCSEVVVDLTRRVDLLFPIFLLFIYKMPLFSMNFITNLWRQLLGTIEAMPCFFFLKLEMSVHACYTSIY